MRPFGRKKYTEIQFRRQGIFFFYIAYLFLFKCKYLSLIPCLRTKKVITPRGYADFLIMAVRLKKNINGAIMAVRLKKK